MSVVSCLRESIRAIDIYISEEKNTKPNKKNAQCNTEMSLAEEMKVYFAWHKNRPVQGDVQNMIWLESWSFQLETQFHINWKQRKDFQTQS